MFHWLGRAVPTGQPSGGGGGPTLPRRLVQLFTGLIGFGVSIAFMVRARLGLGPWDVLHQGLAERTGLEIGSINIAVSVLVLMLWIPLRQRPRVGTVANVIVVGLAVNLALAVLPSPGPLWLRAIFLVVGVVATGVATGLYIGAGLGPGPRDGLMTGLAERGHSIRVVRTGIELSVLLIGWVLGGAVGVGTVLFAVGIGPLAHYFIPKLQMASPAVGDAPGHSGSVVSPTAPTSSSSQMSQRMPRLRRSRRTPGSRCTPTASREHR